MFCPICGFVDGSSECKIAHENIYIAVESAQIKPMCGCECGQKELNEKRAAKGLLIGTNAFQNEPS